MKRKQSTSCGLSKHSNIMSLFRVFCIFYKRIYRIDAKRRVRCKYKIKLLVKLTHRRPQNIDIAHNFFVYLQWNRNSWCLIPKHSIGACVHASGKFTKLLYCIERSQIENKFQRDSLDFLKILLITIHNSSCCQMIFFSHKIKSFSLLVFFCSFRESRYTRIHGQGRTWMWMPFVMIMIGDELTRYATWRGAEKKT